MNKIFIKDMVAGRALTREEFDAEADKIVFDPKPDYVVIHCYDLIEAIIKRQAAINQEIPFVMIPFKSTKHEEELLLKRIEENFVPMPGGYMIATTGGSTTQSKLVFSTKYQRERASKQVIKRTRITSADTMCLLSLAGNGAWISTVLIATLTNATMLVSNEKDIPTIARLINENKPTHMSSSPMMMANLMNNDENDRLGGRIRSWYLGGAPINKRDAHKMENRLGCKMFNGYLHAEGTHALLCDIDDTQEHRIETNGQATMPDTTRIVDGELQLRGDLVINTLLHGENKFTEDGWYKSGDLFHEDEDGYYSVIGRLKVMYTYGAVTLNPIEVEEVVDNIPGVVKSFCVDSDFRPKTKPKKLCVCVIRETADLTKEDIKPVVYDKMSLNCEFFIRWIDDFPMIYSGKINRRELLSLITEYELGDVFMHNLDTDRKITMEQFDEEVDKITYDDSTQYIIIDHGDLIDIAIQMFAAIKNNIPFMMMSKSTTPYTRAILGERVEKDFTPKDGGFQITASGGAASQAKLLYATKEQRDKHSEILIQQLGLTASDVVFNTRNAGSGPWINMTRQCKEVGATMLVTNKRSPEKIALSINEHSDITVLSTTPHLMEHLMNFTDLHNEKGNIRCWHVSGSPTDPDAAYGMEAIMNGCKFIQTLGRAEGVLPYGCDLDDNSYHRIETIGKEIIPGSTRIVDGEMQIAKEWVIPMLDGEHDFTDDGWYKTGDLVEQDNKGYFKIVGCKKPILSYGPRDINPLEIEEIVNSMEYIDKTRCLDGGDMPIICVWSIGDIISEEDIEQTVMELLNIEVEVQIMTCDYIDFNPFMVL